MIYMYAMQYSYVYVFVIYHIYRKSSVSYVFIFQLIRRRYFSDDLPASNPWSVSPVERPVQRLDENSSDDDQSYKKTR